MEKAIDFKAIKLSVASPEKIEEWSHGEVLKPETINYRTQKPEKDGLFCEKIFGPTKDWECYCGKYKRIRYKGVVCDKCGVEVTRSIVRRERMGHIGLAVPVSHIWFLRGVPSKLGIILDLSVQSLEKVIYFASYIIKSVDDNARKEAFEQIKSEFKAKRKLILDKYKKLIEKLKSQKTKELNKIKSDKDKLNIEEKYNKELIAKNEERENELQKLNDAVDIANHELKGIKKLKIISELEYRDLSLKYGQVFQAGIGAEVVREIIENTNINKLSDSLSKQLKSATTSQRKKLMKRLRIIRGMIKANIKPEWMLLTAVPVIPPDLRPMVQLDGGRFATSDLNDLYRRVINRNNRLKKLIELNAPEVICRNEKRMLQEAVDALIDNTARRGQTSAATSTAQKRPLRSLADMLKGKQGRFRQNLLGKRVDYSGRSVIVVGPHLKLYECGIPKSMALELYKPFVISELIKKGYTHNVRSGGKLIEQGTSEVWDALDKVIQNHRVLLNRAPTLHRLGIQAFKPVLIEGRAIQIHPMVCTAFNADFDGDQMAVHVPLTPSAREEANNIMLSSANLLKPATGEPIVTPSVDIVLGCYYITDMQDGKKGTGKIFSSVQEAKLAYNTGKVHIQSRIKVRINGKLTETCVGRIIFNEILPKKMQFLNKLMNKKELKSVVGECVGKFGFKRTAQLLDDVKNIGFEYLTKSGLSWSIDDLVIPKEKSKLIEDTERKVEQIRKQFKSGLLTDEERYLKVIEIWSKVKDDITDLAIKTLNRHSPVYTVVESGARGSWNQTVQMTGMKGLVANPAGKTIELPVKGSLKEGFDVLEYFISTHGARKGMTDTALRTANAGYLTRRLIDVAQDMVVHNEDCGDKEGFVVSKDESEELGITLSKRVLGRFVAEDIIDPKSKKKIIKANEIVTKDICEKIDKADIDKIRIRSILSCKNRRGMCQKCYGWDLSSNKTIEIGQAVGIVAAQSIGEPGTQLTMRTFHTGGVAGGGDITQGLPRVEELFEARPIKSPALISEVEGIAHIEEKDGQKIIKITSKNIEKDVYDLNKKWILISKLKDKDMVEKGQILAEDKDGSKLKSKFAGILRIKDNKLEVIKEGGADKEYVVPENAALWVRDGDLIANGTQLTEGHLDLRQLFKTVGKEATQKYILKEVQHIYSTQGQQLNDKHLEIIVRQMFSRIRVKQSGDTELLPGEIISKIEFDEINKEVKKEGKKIATGEELLLGITKASLSTESFLAAASFQETARVLINAAVMGKTDYLRGLKENVIIGKLIPAGTGFRRS